MNQVKERRNCLLRMVKWGLSFDIPLNLNHLFAPAWRWFSRPTRAPDSATGAFSMLHSLNRWQSDFKNSSRSYRYIALSHGTFKCPNLCCLFSVFSFFLLSNISFDSKPAANLLNPRSAFLSHSSSNSTTLLRILFVLLRKEKKIECSSYFGKKRDVSSGCSEKCTDSSLNHHARYTVNSLHVFVCLLPLSSHLPLLQE